MSPAMELSSLLTALTAYTDWGPWENGLSHQLALREGNVCEGGGEGAPVSFWNLQRGLGKKIPLQCWHEPGGKLALLTVMSRESLLPADPVGSGL